MTNFNIVVPGFFTSIQSSHVEFFSSLRRLLSHNFQIRDESNIKFHCIIFPMNGFDGKDAQTLIQQFEFCSTACLYQDDFQSSDSLLKYYQNNLRITIHCIIEFADNPFPHWPPANPQEGQLKLFLFEQKHPDIVSFSNVFMRRFSPSSFDDRHVPQSILIEALEAARRSPSAGNLQAYSILLVKNREVLEQIAQAALGQGIITDGDGAFVFIIERENSAQKYRSRGRNLYSLQDATIACSHLQLALESFGVQSRWIGAFHDDELKNVLDTNGKDIAGILVFGYGKKKKHLSQRRDLDSYLTVIE